MNASQIKTALKPMADFAPAVLRAAEIVQAAEDAEKKLAVSTREKVAIEMEITELAGRKAEFEQRAAGYLRDFNALVAEGEAKKTAMNEEMLAIRKAVNEAHEELRSVDAQYEEKKNIKAKELAEIQEKIDQVKASFEGFRREHRL